jgi:hypothetical protein
MLCKLLIVGPSIGIAVFSAAQASSDFSNSLAWCWRKSNGQMAGNWVDKQSRTEKNAGMRVTIWNELSCAT